MKKRDLRRISLLLVSSFVFTAIFGNLLVADAATKVLSNFSKVLLSKEDVGNDVYLQKVLTLNDNKSYVGILTSDSEYEYYYGTSDDMINWEINSKYFSLVHGNGVFVGISSGEKNELNYTTNGSEWKVASLPSHVNPMAVKYENGYFKLTSKDNNYKTLLYYSKDAETWYDITSESPVGAKVEDMITVDDKFYSLVGSSISGDSFKVYTTSTIDETKTQWKEIETLKKSGYGLLGNFLFDGKSVGVQLYSLADYKKNGYVSDKLYYITNDFINWEEKDWTQTNSSYYSAYSSTSTDEKSVDINNKNFEAIEVLPYGEPNYYSSSLVYSKDGITWLNEQVNVFVNGEKVSKDRQAKSNIFELEKFEWARKGVEYTVGRNYLDSWIVTEYKESINRGQYLELIMQALNVQEPATPRSGYVPFKDVYWENSLIERANKLGLTSGAGNNRFLPFDSISRQDMMVLTYNVLHKLGKIEPDTSLSVLSGFKDKDKVKDYAKLAVSSLSKAGVIKGDGVNVNPLKNVTYAEAAVIAESLNKYRHR